MPLFNLLIIINMITKFVGAPTDLNNVKRIALVYSSSILLESQIDQLYPDYFGSDLKFLIDVTQIVDNGKYVNGFYLTDFKPFEFNSIIYYDAGMTPIGFSVLDQAVTTSEYGIDTITIIPNFIIDLSDNRYIEVSLGNTDYSEHVSNTDKVHKKLFKASNYAITPKEVLNTSYNPTKFTNQLKEGIGLDRVYRYSGNFSMGDAKLIQNNYQITYNYTPINNQISIYTLLSYYLTKKEIN